MIEVAVQGQVGSFALDASFSSGSGVTALFGRSGSGKSTIVGMIAGLVRPVSGRIVVGDRVLFDSAHGIDIAARHRRVGMVFQEARLFPHMSVARNLTYGRWAGRRGDGRSFDEVVGLLGLQKLLQRRPQTLSGGEKQRVAIGRALLSAPEILLMDEPLASLDEPRKAEILPYLERLRRETSIPIVYVSHAIDEVARLAETLVIVSGGKVAAVGPLAEVLTRIDLGPATGRHEASSVLEGVVARHDTEWQLTEIAVGEALMRLPQIDMPVGTRMRLRVRARDVAISLAAPTGTSFQNILPGEVIEVAEDDTPLAELVLSVSGQRLRARLTRRSMAELDLKPGKPVFAMVKSMAFERRLVGSE
ncbi:MAG: molybdenum ABC transporter ATP-binding protein [Hyphomicrobiales bacterium]|nr:MAG: molybdenum ABC transporter ATP-binding protein [Hyphomicrobiales bacterium]